MPNYVTAARINGILDQLSHHRAQGIYKGGLVRDSVIESRASKPLQVFKEYNSLPTAKP